MEKLIQLGYDMSRLWEHYWSRYLRSEEHTSELQSLYS